MTLYRKPLLGASALLGSAALVLSGCATADPGGETGGESAGEAEAGGVSYGAAKDEWIAAFETVEPFEIRAQTPAAQGSQGSIPWERYFGSLEEYSGGKITVDLGYAYAYAGPTEVDEAIEEGTLDMGPLLPTLDAAKFPAFTAMSNLTYLTASSALAGILHANAYQSEVIWNTPEVAEEYEAAGLKMVWAANSLLPTGLLCSRQMESAGDLEGAQSQASSPAAGAQLEAVGVTPVALPYTEVYESIQRGVIDCSNVFPGQAHLFGVTEVAPFIHFAPEAGLIHTPGSFGANKDWIESLPLVAQQLIFDQQTLFYRETALGAWKQSLDAVAGATEHGGGVFDLPSDVQQTMVEDGNNVLKDQTETSPDVDGASMVTRMEDGAESWLSTLEEFGIDTNVRLDEMGAWLDENEPDLDGIMNRMYEQFIQEHRPS